MCAFNLGAGGWHSKHTSISLEHGVPCRVKEGRKTNPPGPSQNLLTLHKLPRGREEGGLTRKWRDDNHVSTLAMQRYINVCEPDCCGLRGRMVTSGTGDRQVKRHSFDVGTALFSEEVMKQFY